MNFVETLWSIFIAFLFVAYLILLFHIISDLFRDRDLPGWGKAVWVFCLLIAPVITSLIYIIWRGRGMALRTEEHTLKALEDSENYIRQVAGKPTPAQQIATAKSLLDTGAIDDSEYTRLKTLALS